MSGGGKGGGSTSKTEIPSWVEEPSKRNLRRAEVMQQLDYMPYIGGDVATPTATGEAVKDNIINQADAFGFITPKDRNEGLLPVKDIGGVRGYSAFPLFEQARMEFEQRDPNQARIRGLLFGDADPADSKRVDPRNNLLKQFQKNTRGLS
jgi:hypothetical protein